MNRAIEITVAGTLLLGVSYVSWTVAEEVHGLFGQVGALIGHVDDSVQSTNAFLKDAKASMDDNYYDIKATLETVAVTAKDSDDLVHDLRASLVGGKDTQGVERDGLMVEAGALVAALQSDLGKLTDSADAALRPLGETLQHITTLTDTLNKQIASGGAGVQQTAAALTKSINDFDKLLDDPDIEKILAGAAKTSDHLAGSAETLDIVMRPWRKKASQLKVILEKALGLIKFTYPL